MKPMTPKDHEAAGTATIANWRSNPFSHWSFRSIREIIPVADIEPTAGAPMDLPQAGQPLKGFELRLGGGLPMTLPDFLQTTATDGLVVLKDGSVVFEFYANGMTDRTPHILMSASKSIAGLIAGLLQQRGELAVDAPVSEYVPEVAGTAYQGATVRHLLDMRAGVILTDEQANAYEAATNWGPAVQGQAAAGLQAFFTHLTAAAPIHGGAFSYISANTDLLGWVMERATGRRFADLVSHLLWQPMGAAHGAYVTVDGGGAPRCTGGLCATVRDFARIGQLLVDGGRRGGISIIPAAWIDDITANGDRDAWRTGQWGESFAALSRNMSYRSGWYNIHDQPQLLFAMGVYGQNLFIDRANRIVIAKVSSQSAATDYRAIGLTHAAVATIQRCLDAPA